MTKSKKVGKKEKRINQTAHQRAMANPKAREALRTLRARWSDLSRLQRGEQLNVLKIEFKFSVRGIAREIGESATTIQRCIDLVNPPEDWITTMQNTWAVEPEEQSTMSAGYDVCHFPPKIQAKKIVEPVIKETCAAQDHAQTPATQQTKKIASPLSTKVMEPPVVNGAVSRQEGQVGERIPKSSLVDAYMRRDQIKEDKRRRFEAIADQIPPRPIFDATSMKRQGKQVPPKDPHGPVS
jgi:hypothetical protein